ncbi:MAG: NAD(P)-dependent dehydrogenase (short-subunit alcohol dehydrogenase family) [Urechidicola sp.]
MQISPALVYSAPKSEIVEIIMAVSQAGSLCDKVVLVTAGGSGIGRVIVEAYLALGAKVHTCDISQSMLDECHKKNPTLTTSICDVSDENQVKALFDDLIKQHGRLDILVNNAGISGATAAIEDVEIDDWDKTLAVDLRGTFLVTRLAVPLLKQVGSGSLINMSSNAGLFGTPLRSPYAAAKWAIIGLTKTWAMELGPFGIRVNAICPGCVEGPRIDGVIERDAIERGMQPDEIRDVYQRQSSLRKFVSAQDIANMATFISSDLGANISGQSLSVDGHTEGLSNWLD